MFYPFYFGLSYEKPISPLREVRMEFVALKNATKICFPSNPPTSIPNPLFAPYPLIFISVVLLGDWLTGRLWLTFNPNQAGSFPWDPEDDKSRYRAQRRVGVSTTMGGGGRSLSTPQRDSERLETPLEPDRLFVGTPIGGGRWERIISPPTKQTTL